MSSLNEPVFNIDSIVLKSRTVGPHERLAIFFQGCDINCEGCSNQNLVPFRKKHMIPLSKLMIIITEAQRDHGIEGVTLLGGEPTLQKGLSELCSAIKSMDLGLILYTGKLMNETEKSILNQMDLVIDGPFLKHQMEHERRGIGSRNQRLILLSERYKNDISWFYESHREGEFSLSDNHVDYTGDEIILFK